MRSPNQRTAPKLCSFPINLKKVQQQRQIDLKQHDKQKSVAAKQENKNEDYISSKAVCSHHNQKDASQNTSTQTSPLKTIHHSHLGQQNENHDQTHDRSESAEHSPIAAFRSGGPTTAKRTLAHTGTSPLRMQDEKSPTKASPEKASFSPTKLSHIENSPGSNDPTSVMVSVGTLHKQHPIF